MAAIVSPGGPTMAIKFAVDGLDRFWGDHRWRDRSHKRLDLQSMLLWHT